jgi:hypothetical protein
MAVADHTLTLYVPGLLNPVANLEGLPSASWPRLDALRTLLSRGRWQSRGVSGFEPTLFHLFGYAAEPDADLPTAAICRLAEGGSPDDGWWLRADPVHLHADQRSLIMVAHEKLNLSGAEAAELQRTVAEAFVDQGWQWELPVPNRWYVRLPQPPRIRTHCLAATLGQDILARLPVGEDATFWHRYLNEVQMLLHAHPINQTRVEGGQLAVNSVWFWGGGRLPPVAQAPWTQLRSDHFPACALARYAGIEHAPLPAGGGIELGGASAMHSELVVLDELYRPARLSDPYAWLDALSGLEQRWFAPLLTALRRGAFGALTLVTDDGRVCSARSAELRRWWRRVRPAVDFLHIPESTRRGQSA